MSDPRPSRRTVGLVVGVALVVVGAVIAAFAVFGGSDGGAKPEPSRPPTPPATSQPPTADPTMEPTDPEPVPTLPPCLGAKVDVDPYPSGDPVEVPPVEPTSLPCGEANGSDG